jgi:signal transduction histidine kinase
VEIHISRGPELATIAVDDSGPGIAPDIRDQLFEALATTKRDGLGLGLSMSRSIVQAHGGTIHVETSPLGGARFIVTLPLEKS